LNGSINILHLSDLHIINYGESFSPLLKKLLDENIKNYENKTVIIVVTGDIVNRGDYSNSSAVIKFFEGLKEVIGDKFKGIYIVPGNHDKIRNIYDENIINLYLDNKEIALKEEEWSYLECSFLKFNKMKNDIYKVFLGDEIQKNEKSFGIGIEKFNNINICFLLLNTTYGAKGNSNKRNLFLGDYQIKYLESEYIKKDMI